MHILLEINESLATRFLTLKNIETGVIDYCFDDSELLSKENFSFMKLLDIYDCKIKLLGKPSNNYKFGCIYCKIVNKEIIVGKRCMVEVEVDGNKYYISKNKLPESINNGFYFHYTRKDIIQADNILHPDFS